MSIARVLQLFPNRARQPSAMVLVRSDGWYGALKPSVDAILAAVLLALALPLILMALLVIKLTSRGPVLYSQTRVGQHGRLFTLYKIRTMQYRCEDATGACWATRRDPRITLVGRFLRRTHIDELPQLWNVLRGEMSLVGPRPERPEFVPELARAIPRYADRLLVRPGLTGLAQIQLPPDTDLTSVFHKLICDLHYTRNVGFALDLRILAGTPFSVLGVPFLVTGKLLQIPGLEAIGHARRSEAGSDPIEAVTHVQPV